MVENPSSADEPEGGPASKTPSRTPRQRASAAATGSTRRTVRKASAEPRKAAPARSLAATTQPLIPVESTPQAAPEPSGEIAPATGTSSTGADALASGSTGPDAAPATAEVALSGPPSAVGVVETRSYWPETESVLVRLGLVEKDGRAVDASPPTDDAACAGTDDDGAGTFPIGSIPHPITIAEPVPTFDALVSRTRARAKASDDTQRLAPPGPLGPGPQAPRIAAAPSARPFGQRLVSMLPTRASMRRLLSARPVRAKARAGSPDPASGTRTPVRSAAPASRPAGTTSGEATVADAVPARAGAGASGARSSRVRTSRPARRPRGRLTPAQWRSGARTALVLVVLLLTAAPAAVLGWRSALAEAPDAGGVVGGGLGVVGLILLAVGVLRGTRAGSAAEGGTQSPATLLARPGALSAVLGVAVLLCAAIAVG